MVNADMSRNKEYESNRKMRAFCVMNNFLDDHKKISTSKTLRVLHEIGANIDSINYRDGKILYSSKATYLHAYNSEQMFQLRIAITEHPELSKTEAEAQWILENSPPWRREWNENHFPMLD